MFSRPPPPRLISSISYYLRFLQVTADFYIHLAAFVWEIFLWRSPRFYRTIFVDKLSLTFNRSFHFQIESHYSSKLAILWVMTIKLLMKMIFVTKPIKFHIIASAVFSRTNPFSSQFFIRNFSEWCYGCLTGLHIHA